MSTEDRVCLHDYTIVSSEEVARDVWRVVIASGELARRIEPGQFVNLNVPGDPSQIVRVPLSFASADAERGTIELVLAVVGDGTRRLAALPVGEGSTVVGPCGKGWRLPDAADAAAGERRVLLVAGGIGSTPIVAAGRALAERGVKFEAVIAAQTAERLWGVDELRALGANVVVCTDDGTAGVKGFATVAVPQLLAERPFSEIWTCGPAPMMAGVARLADMACLPCQASLERMMTCGFGACHTCNVAMADGGYKFCCTDGPVFDAKEVAW